MQLGVHFIDFNLPGEPARIDSSNTSAYHHSLPHVGISA